MTQINNKYEETKLVVITRSDIAPGYQVVQSTHSIADFAHEHPETFANWKAESNSIICLSTQSEETLLKLYEKYKRITPVTLFYEPDVNAYTSLCLYGTPKVRKSLSHLSLSLKEKKS